MPPEIPEPGNGLSAEVFTDVLADHAERLLNANGYDSIMGALVHMFAVMQADGAVILPDAVDLGWVPR